MSAIWRVGRFTARSSAGLVWIAVFYTRSVSAQPAPAGPHHGRFPIVVEGELEEATYSLGYENQPPFVQCGAVCSLYAYPAHYELSVRGQGVLPGSASFELTRPSRVQVSPMTEGKRTLGLVLGVAGVALLAAGTTLFLMGNAEGSQRNGLPNGPTLIGVPLFFAGAALTPIGFLLYGRRSPSVDVEPL